LCGSRGMGCERYNLFRFFLIVFCHLWKFARSLSICIDLYVMASAFFRIYACELCVFVWFFR
jgi:hypothetical protein